MLCGHHTGITVILHFQANLPDLAGYTRRWIGEQVFAVQFDTSSYVSNTKGFPVLSKAHQELCRTFMKKKSHFILKGKHPSDNLDEYYQYLCHVFKGHDSLDEEEKLEVPYRDYLQSPLQPLADNLEAATYEVFENDTIKYDLYEDSLFKAFTDKKKYGKFFQTTAKLSEHESVLPLQSSDSENEMMVDGESRTQVGSTGRTA